jgi:hypothetical protein
MHDPRKNIYRSLAKTLRDILTRYRLAEGERAVNFAPSKREPSNKNAINKTRNLKKKRNSSNGPKSPRSSLTDMLLTTVMIPVFR